MQGGWSRGSAEGRSKPFPVTKWNNPNDERTGPSYLSHSKQLVTRTEDLLLQVSRSSPLKFKTNYTLGLPQLGVSPADPRSRQLRKRGDMTPKPLSSLCLSLKSLSQHPKFDTQTVNAGTTILLWIHDQTFQHTCDCNTVQCWDVRDNTSSSLL